MTASESTVAARAEALLNRLVGVVSARVVTDEAGGIREIHVLSTPDITPKQAVRNVESALLAHLDLAVDHRAISVAQSVPGAALEPAAGTPRSTEAPAEAPSPEPEAGARAGEAAPRSGSPGPGSPAAASPPAHEPRLVFVSHQVISERAQRVVMRVTLEWKGRRYEGGAGGPDLARSRLETVARATLRAIEAVLEASGEPAGRATLNLDGVSRVEAFDRTFVMVAVHALVGREVTPLTGAVRADESPERAAILATLQATDRRMRAVLEPPRAPPPGPATPNERAPGDPFDIWG